jgi:hypothetical protein
LTPIILSLVYFNLLKNKILGCCCFTSLASFGETFETGFVNPVSLVLELVGYPSAQARVRHGLVPGLGFALSLRRRHRGTCPPHLQGDTHLSICTATSSPSAPPPGLPRLPSPSTLPSPSPSRIRGAAAEGREGAGDGGPADPCRDRERGQVQAQEVPPGVQEELPRRQDR